MILNEKKALTEIKTFAEAALEGVRDEGVPCEGVIQAEGMLLGIINRLDRLLGQQQNGQDRSMLKVRRAG